MQYLQLLKLVLTLFPLIIDTIKVVENAIPGSGKGEEKLTLIRSVLENAFIAATDVTARFEQLWPMLSSTISAIVDTFNKTGIFNKAK